MPLKQYSDTLDLMIQVLRDAQNAKLGKWIGMANALSEMAAHTEDNAIKISNGLKGLRSCFPQNIWDILQDVIRLSHNASESCAKAAYDLRQLSSLNAPTKSESQTFREGWDRIFRR